MRSVLSVQPHIRLGLDNLRAQGTVMLEDTVCCSTVSSMLSPLRTQIIVLLWHRSRARTTQSQSALARC